MWSQPAATSGSPCAFEEGQPGKIDARSWGVDRVSGATLGGTQTGRHGQACDGQFGDRARLEQPVQTTDEQRTADRVVGSSQVHVCSGRNGLLAQRAQRVQTADGEEAHLGKVDHEVRCPSQLQPGLRGQRRGAVTESKTPLTRISTTSGAEAYCRTSNMGSAARRGGEQVVSTSFIGVGGA